LVIESFQLREDKSCLLDVRSLLKIPQPKDHELASFRANWQPVVQVLCAETPNRGKRTFLLEQIENGRVWPMMLFFEKLKRANPENTFGSFCSIFADHARKVEEAKRERVLFGQLPLRYAAVAENYAEERTWGEQARGIEGNLQAVKAAAAATEEAAKRNKLLVCVKENNLNYRVSCNVGVFADEPCAFERKKIPFDPDASEVERAGEGEGKVATKGKSKGERKNAAVCFEGTCRGKDNSVPTCRRRGRMRVRKQTCRYILPTAAGVCASILAGLAYNAKGAKDKVLLDAKRFKPRW
jgi:hypothetical protein